MISMMLLFSASVRLYGQSERYDLGRRLKAFETTWEQADEKGRMLAAKTIRPATRQFLTFQLSEAGRTIDQARFALQTPKPSEFIQWAAALDVVPAARILEPDQKELAVTLKQLYTPEAMIPSAVSVRLRVGEGPATTLKLAELPTKATLPLPAAGAKPIDLAIQLELESGEERLTMTGPIVVQAAHLESLLADLEKVGKTAAGANELRIERASAIGRVEILNSLTEGVPAETDYPIARLLAESAELVEAVRESKPFFTPERTGQFWLNVPTGPKRFVPCRLYVPEGLKSDKPVPIVVAMHGAGGSENLFFEGYGDGCVAKACAERGWLMVAPRSGLSFLGGTTMVPELVDQLADRYPIDKSRVYLVGHSMGAAQTLDQVQKKPGYFAAAAALGGGGRIRNPEAFAQTPLLIGVGSDDFALSGATAIRDALEKASNQLVTYKQYPGIEHTLIVRAAVDDLFSHFESSSPKAQKPANSP